MLKHQRYLRADSFSGSQRFAVADAMLPRDFPPVTTVQRYFYAWRDTGLWSTINHLLLMAVRLVSGRAASPSAGVIDSQSVKPPRAVGLAGMMRARVRLEGACHLWRKIPSRQLSINLEADERYGWATGRAEAS